MCKITFGAREHDNNEKAINQAFEFSQQSGVVRRSVEACFLRHKMQRRRIHAMHQKSRQSDAKQRRKSHKTKNEFELETRMKSETVAQKLADRYTINQITYNKMLRCWI